LSREHETKAGREKECSGNHALSEKTLKSALITQGNCAALKCDNGNRELPNDSRGVPKLCRQEFVDFKTIIHSLSAHINHQWNHGRIICHPAIKNDSSAIL